MFMCQCVLLVTVSCIPDTHHVSMGTNVAYVGVTMDASTHLVVQLLPYMDIYIS